MSNNITQLYIYQTSFNVNYFVAFSTELIIFIINSLKHAKSYQHQRISPQYSISLRLSWQFIPSNLSVDRQVRNRSSNIIPTSINTFILPDRNIFTHSKERQTVTLPVLYHQYELLDTAFKLIMFRISVVGVIESLMFLSLTKIPVSLVSTIFNTSPIFAFFLEAIVYRVNINIYVETSKQS